MSEQILAETVEEMKMAILAFKEKLAAIPDGRIDPAMFDKIEVDYYGSKMSINELVTVSMPERGLAILTPVDISLLANMEQAIRKSRPDVSLRTDSKSIRVTARAVSQERSQEYIATAQAKAEEGRVSIKDSRSKARTALAQLPVDSVTSDEEKRRALTELEETGEKYLTQIDELLKRKVTELTII